MQKLKTHDINNKNPPQRMFYQYKKHKRKLPLGKKTQYTGMLLTYQGTETNSVAPARVVCSWKLPHSEVVIVSHLLYTLSAIVTHYHTHNKQQVETRIIVMPETDKHK